MDPKDPNIRKMRWRSIGFPLGASALVILASIHF